MNEQVTSSKFDMETTEIDLLDMIRLLWSKVWVIIIAMLLCGTVAFGGAMVSVAPQYTARAMMYVNNSSLSLNGASITFSSSQLSAAKSLLDVYVIILKSRTTLEEVIEEADLPYTYAELSNMVSAGSVSGTEIFSITATCENPEDAKIIVDTIVDILPDRISEIVDGSSVRLVDRAVLPNLPSSPSNVRYALIGALAGAVVSCALIILSDILNTTVRDEDYLKQRYNIPILAVVPDVYDETKKKYAYAGKYGYQSHGRNRGHSTYEERYENAKTESGDKR